MPKTITTSILRHKKLLFPLSIVFSILAVVSMLGVWFTYRYWFPPVFKLTEQDLGSEVLMETNFGTIDIVLNRKSIFAVSQFTRLARNGFYDGTRIHRIVPDLLLEGGDPLTKDVALKSLWGQGGSESVFKNEIHPDDKMEEGTFVMAGSDLGTYGSHFFIITKAASWMQGKHTIIGKVKLGMDIVHKIEALPISVTGFPIQDVVINKVTVL